MGNGFNTFSFYINISIFSGSKAVLANLKLNLIVKSYMSTWMTGWSSVPPRESTRISCIKLYSWASR